MNDKHFNKVFITNSMINFNIKLRIQKFGSNSFGNWILDIEIMLMQEVPQNSQHISKD